MEERINVAFVSNYFNHHQKPFSEAMFSKIGNGYAFIETEPMEEERVKMGWSNQTEASYVHRMYLSEQNYAECQKIIDDADVVIIGSAPNRVLKTRMKLGKLIFRYSERPLKNGKELTKYVPRLFLWRARNPQNKPMYLLCASAYTAYDYSLFKLFKNKAYKWGYFPETVRYEQVESLMERKTKNSILWVSRFLDWKHPETAVEIADRLAKDGYDFQLNMIGSGPLENETKLSIESKGLTDRVKMLGAMSPQDVRKHMEESAVFIFTSDYHEGWGAVANEAMNSGCAVVASSAIGAVPFLIKHQENGLIYQNGNTDDLYGKVKHLLKDADYRQQIGIAAYKTITETWNAESAAERLIRLSKALLASETSADLFEEGICSKAEVLKNDWFKEKETK